MLHIRQWHVEKTDSVDVVAEKLNNYQNECFGIQIDNVIFINDSTDVGIKEYAVVDATRNIQIDSWTVDWMGKFELSNSVRKLLANHTEYESLPTYNQFNPSMITLCDAA